MEFLKPLGISSVNKGTSTGSKWWDSPAAPLEAYSPVDGKKIATVSSTDRKGYDQVVQQAREAFLVWQTWPAPKRGEIVRQIGEKQIGRAHV